MDNQSVSDSQNWAFHPFSDMLWWNFVLRTTDTSGSWNTVTLDFNHRCFQKPFLVWVPFVFLWMAAMAPREPSNVQTGRLGILPRTRLSLSKLILTIMLTTLSVADLLHTLLLHVAEVPIRISGDDLVENIVGSVTFVLFTGLMFIENRRTKLSSNTLITFWLLVLTSGIIKMIKISAGVGDTFIYAVQIVHICLVVGELLLTSLEDDLPNHTRDNCKTCPEQSSSIPSRVTFSWMTGLIYKGWRRPLKQLDLWDLSATDKTNTHAVTLAKHWEAELISEHHSEKSATIPDVVIQTQLYHASLTKAVTKTVARTFILTTCLRVIVDFAVFILPMLLNWLIAFVSDESQEPWKGFLCVFLMFAGSVLQTLAANYYFFHTQRCGMHIHSALVSMVYQKAIRLSNSARHSTTVGTMVNLMASDSQQLGDIIERIQILWSAPMQISLAICLLWHLLGSSILMGLAAMLLLIPVNALIIHTIQKLLVKNTKNNDDRMNLMHEILSAMKILKLYAWERSFQDRVLKIRELELAILAKAAYLNVVSTFLSTMFPFIVASVTFTTYVWSDPSNLLDAPKVFVSLSLFHILRQPVTNLPDFIGDIIQARESLRRITKFLRSSELDLSNMKVVSSSVKMNKPRINVSNGTFSWTLEEEFCLRNINLDVIEGQFIGVVGDVGAGKTSLCCALMDLMDKQSGTLTRQGAVAYVSQQAWIQNLSLKENILFGNEFNGSLYKKVVNACALQADIDSLPAGDLTEIGENGANLSGGQKQRVNLARALYSEADIYFLDDPLSAVDTHVGNHIFRNVIGGTGLLKDKIRILVTHGTAYLQHTDQILVLTNGMISEVSTFSQLLSKGYFGTSLQSDLTETIPDPSDYVTIATTGNEVISKGHLPLFHNTTNDAIAKTSANTKYTDAVAEKENNNANHPQGTLIQKEPTETGGVKWSTYLIYLKHFTAPVAVITLCFYICAVIASVGNSFWLRDWSREGYDSSHQNNTHGKSFRSQFFAVIGWIHVVFILLAALMLAYGQNMASRKQHEAMLQRILQAPMTFFNTNPVARIANSFSADIDAVDTGIPMNLRAWLNCVFSAISMIIVIFLSTPIFAAVLMPLGVLYYLILRFFIPTGRQLKRLELVTRSPVYSHFQESLAGRNIILATKSVDRFVQQNETLMDRCNTASFPNIASEMWLSIRVELIGSFIAVFAGLFAVIGRDQDWGISANDIGLVVTYALSVTATLNWLVYVTTSLESNIISVERIKEYSDAPVEVSLEGLRPDDSWPQEGIVEFVGYETRYRTELNLVLKGVTFRINGAEKVGIVGRTGAGKSSLTMALFRVIERTKGSIRVDNVDIATIGLNDLRSRITIIPQEPVLFSGTLRFNLDPALKYSDIDIWSALRSSHLTQFVQSLPSGLQYAVTDGGDNLSVGQRQLICLARAVLRKTRILVMDEPTSAVDITTDALIQRTIRETFAHCTVLIIAHRLDTVMGCSRVMVLDEGVVKEFDSPLSLLQDHNSLFYGLTRSATHT